MAVAGDDIACTAFPKEAQAIRISPRRTSDFSSIIVESATPAAASVHAPPMRRVFDDSREGAEPVVRRRVLQRGVGVFRG